MYYQFSHRDSWILAERAATTQGHPWRYLRCRCPCTASLPYLRTQRSLRRTHFSPAVTSRPSCCWFDNGLLVREAPTTAEGSKFMLETGGAGVDSQAYSRRRACEATASPSRELRQSPRGPPCGRGGRRRSRRLDSRPGPRSGRAAGSKWFWRGGLAPRARAPGGSRCCSSHRLHHVSCAPQGSNE